MQTDNMQVYRHTGRQTDNTQLYRHRGRQTGTMQVYKHTGRQADIKAYTHYNNLIGRQRNRQTCGHSHHLGDTLVSVLQGTILLCALAT